MIDDEENETRKYTTNQMKDIINLATATENSQVQSILLGIASAPPKDGDNKKIPSQAARHRLLGMKRATFYFYFFSIALFSFF